MQSAILEPRSLKEESEETAGSRSSDHWRIDIEFGISGATNMDRDEALARELLTSEQLGDSCEGENGLDLPNVLRLYTWKPSAISLGYQQSDSAIDLVACERAGIDVVRRPTGGRAVYHANELTYAVAMRAVTSEGIYAVHNRITSALLGSLRFLGERPSALELTGSENNTRTNYQGVKPTNIACFASTSRHEAISGGRKFLGSAQRRFGNVVLQHGSILLGDEHLRLNEFLKLSDSARSEMRAILRDQTTTLSEVFERPIGALEAAECLKEHFVAEWSATERQRVLS